jgi:hydrophobic/amphiphilic exporter-1 (mainly G- bacteria), HAE1 family
MALGAILIGGVFAFYRLPLDLAPQVDYPAMTIRTMWPGASPETVERLVTAPIEELAGTVKGVHKISSTSTEGESSVSLECDPATEMNFARLQLNELLAAFNETKPPGVYAPVIRPFVPKDLRQLQGFLTYTLVGHRSPRDLTHIAQEFVSPRLMSVRGVGNVEVYGGSTRAIIIEVDGARAALLGVRPEQIRNALNEVAFHAGAGEIRQGGDRIVLEVGTRSGTVAEIGRLPISRPGQTEPVRISDIAVVRDGADDPHSFYRINGLSCVTVVIDKEQSVNTLEVADEVFARVGEIGQNLPPGCTLLKQSDQSQHMRQELAQLYRDITFSVGCLFLILVLFLGNLRSPLLLLSSILFSIAGTFLVFRVLNMGLNLLTIGGLVLGFGRLVDDSIVVMDNIQRHVARGGADKKGPVSAAVREIARPVIASTITTVGALVPIVFLPLDLRLMFGGFAVAVSAALLLSLLVSFTLIPLVMSRDWFSWGIPRVLTKLGDAGTAAYMWLLRKVMAHRKWLVLATIWCFGLPIWLLPTNVEPNSWPGALYNVTIGSEVFQSARPYLHYALGGVSFLFFEKVQKGEMWNYGNDTHLSVWTSFPPGTEIERYDTVAQMVEREVLAAPAGVRKLTTRVLDDNTYITVNFTDSAANTEIPFILKERLTMLAVRVGGASIAVSGFGPGFYSGGGGAGGQFQLKILGYNFLKVRDIAEKLRERLQRNPRVADVDIDRSMNYRWEKSFELAAYVDREAVAQAGLTVRDVIFEVRGRTVGAVAYDEIGVENTRVPCVVKVAGYRDFSVRDLEQAVIPDQDGNPVRLGTLIHFEQRPIPGAIERENHEYVRNISYEFKGPFRYGEAFLEKTLKEISLPPGYRFDRPEYSFLLSAEKKESLLLIAVVAVVIVFMVTASLYESFFTPLVIILAIPFSLIGLFLAFYLTDTSFGRGGYASVVLLIGIAVSNSIVLADHIRNRVRSEGGGIEVVIRAAADRLRPVLMTTLATIAGLLPLFWGGDQTSVWYGLALGTIGGLITSMVLTLVVIPAVVKK